MNTPEISTMSLLSSDVATNHYQSIIQSSDDAIISKTLVGTITSWNAGAEVLFGYSAKEMLGQSMLRLFPEGRENEETFILEKIIEGEKVDHFETVRIRKDGRLINVSVTISPVFDENGDIVGASKIARDITAQKVSEDRLHLLSSVFLNTHESIVITDPYGQIIEVNEAFCYCSGYSRAEVIGQTPNMFMSSRQGPELATAIRNALNTHYHYQGEVWSRRKTGEAYAGFLTVNTVRDTLNQVQHYVALFTDITPLRLKQEQLEHLANFDSLTDLPNRILLGDRLSQAMTLCQRQDKLLAVLYLDLDGFKNINDTYGHDVGDELLIAVSHNMRKVMRDIDTLARIGGDEYVAVLVDVSTPYDCSQLIERILMACAEPVIIRGHELQISASIGATLFPQSSVGANGDQLIRQADRAMYEAKQAGKNRFHLFDFAYEDEVTNRGLQLRRIDQAVNAQEFDLYYQPKVNMRTGKVFGVEALIRWNHPEQGILLPASFLPLTENNVLSETIGKWVLETALSQMNEWKKLGLSMSVSVNVGARQLQQPNFTAQLAAVLEDNTEINPTDLELEILETSPFQDIHAVSNVMRNCHDLGVRFSIDDFGTGFSSLTYLRRLPAETLKIDQSFVRDMLEDPEDLAIVEGIIGLASAFGREVVAEGVETENIGEKLLSLGCELAQGFVIARPMPAQEIPQWVAKWRPFPTWTVLGQN